MSGGFHSEDELRKMEQHPSVRAIRIGRTKPYDCSYPEMTERPKIHAERSESHEDICREE
jgi:hypothetical protein